MPVVVVESPPTVQVEEVQVEEMPAAVSPDETPIATQTATAMQVLGQTGETFPRPPRRRVVAIANQKGGVGKTTTTVNIAAAMALHGLRVLVIDLDPQGNASTALGIDHHAEIPSVYDLLIEGKSLGDVAIEVAEIPGLSCVPATIDLAGAEIELVSLVAREARLEARDRRRRGCGRRRLRADRLSTLAWAAHRERARRRRRGADPDPVRVLRARGTRPVVAQHRAGQVAPEPRPPRFHDPAHDVRRPHQTRVPGR